MNQSRSYFLVALVGLSAYLIQRSLMFLAEYLEFDDTLRQTQAQGGFLGVDLSFTYLGMHIFWPYLISICLLGYAYSKTIENAPVLLVAFERSLLAKVSALSLLPLLALSLHFFVIFEFFLDNLETATTFQDGQQGQKVPSATRWVAAATISILITVSFIVSVFSLFRVSMPNKLSQKDASEAGASA